MSLQAGFTRRSDDSLFYKIVISIFAVLIGSIPFDIWYGIKSLLGPVGFWQNLIIVGAGFYFFGIIQLVFIVFTIIFLADVWKKR